MEQKQIINVFVPSRSDKEQKRSLEDICNMKSNKSVHSIIYKLRNDRHLKQEDVAAALDVSREVLNHWESGTRHIKAEHLKKLAMYYGVSSDYLLGLSDVASSNPAVSDVCKYTGLSEDAVKKLHSVYFDKQSKAFISRLIAEYGENFHDLYSYIAGAIDSQKLTSEEDVNVSLATHVKAGGVNPKYYDSVPSGAEILPADKACDFKLSEASRVFRELIKDYVESSIQEK